MFGRGKQTQQFDITAHPDVIAALNAMAEEWYERGCRDQLAKVTDLRDEIRADLAAPHSHYLDALDKAIDLLES